LVIEDNELHTYAVVVVVVFRELTSEQLSNPISFFCIILFRHFKYIVNMSELLFKSFCCNSYKETNVSSFCMN